ncbi:MAG: HAD family phosphatase [Eubacteriales bacterium]|nr:HAD family phosphatase [Eubacteriales bacterium]
MRRAVLFDMDGVISDTERFYIDGMVEKLKEEGVVITPWDLKDLFGSTQVYIWNQLIERYHLEGTVEEYVDAVHEIRDRLIQREGLHPMPGVLELIRELHEAGVLLAVASSSPRETIERNMKMFDVLDCFDTIVSGLECRQGKPAPEIYLKAAENLGVMPKECVVIEDSVNGVKAGKAAGMYCHAYVPPQAYSQDVSVADDVITSFAGLPIDDILRNNK